MFFKKIIFLFLFILLNTFSNVLLAEEQSNETKEQEELLLDAVYSINEKENFSPTQENDCSHLDLRTLGRLAEPRNQGSIAWCYAHAASDLLQFHYQTDKISASDLAIQYNKTFVPTVMKKVTNFFSWLKKSNKRNLEHETGFVKIALKKIMKVGYCTYENFPDDVVERYYPRTSKTKLIDFGFAMKDLQRNLVPAARSNDSRNLPYIYRFPEISDQEFVNVLKNEKPRKIYKKLVDLSCEKRFSLPKTNIGQFVVLGNGVKKIDHQLSKNNPVVIDYFSNVLSSSDLAKAKKGSLHTSLLMGRRWTSKNSKCEFLLRNSYGSSCDRYSSSYTCEKGYVWIPQENLYHASLLATYLHK